LTELHGIDAGPQELARVVGRARRSAIGTWTFAGGGLVVEGGRKVGHDDSAPLLARLPFPPSWRCVVAVPDAPAGVSGAAEAQAMAQLPSPPEGDVERVAYLVLMGLLPALVEGDVATFGSSLSEIQERTGEWWAPAQGGTFAPGPSADLVRCMREWGVPGVGQSSWGPAVYGILEGEAPAARLAERLREALGPRGAVYEGPFRSDGARVWRAQLDENLS
jgi:beta-RFAP synthase